MTETRLRLTLVGGYLGSGKTTWLRHQIHAGTFATACILVNEAAGTPVDDVLLSAGMSMHVLAGGCACCEGQEAFRKALLAICDRRSAGALSETEIVLETSGLADPSAIVSLIQSDPILTRHIVVSSVIVIVDALFGADVLASETLGATQVDAADQLVLTKIDQATDHETARLRKTLKALSPAATVSGAVYGSDVTLPPLGETVTALDLAGCGDTIPKPMQLDLGPSPDWTALTVWLSCLLHARGDQIVRAKGVVDTPAGRLLLQTVRRVVQAPEILPSGTRAMDNTLVLIGRDLDASTITASYRSLIDPT